MASQEQPKAYHERITDPDLRIIWKEMGWKRSVKGRHFVLAIRNYFHEKFGPDLDAEEANGLTEGNSVVNTTENAESDKWALAYISADRVRPILEAFDDDNSGFVSVWEANHLTSSRPKDWSLLHWLAYWAAGWHYTVWQYREKICAIIQRMFDLLRWHVLPLNRKIVEGYLRGTVVDNSIVGTAFKDMELLLRSVKPYPSSSDAEIKEKISAYTQREESRLERKLESISFEIDPPRKIKLITGNERVEQFLFPLLYLMLKRHLRIIKMSCSIILHDDELASASRSLTNIFEIVGWRINTMSEISLKFNSDLSILFGGFAFGMFERLNDPDDHLALIEDLDLYGFRELETNDEIDASLLKYGEHNLFDTSAYYDSENPFVVDGCVSDLIAGTWTGNCLTFGYVGIDGLLDLRLEQSTEDNTFHGDAEDNRGRATVKGHVILDGQAEADIIFSKDDGRDHYNWKMWFFGKLDIASRSIRGKWGYNRQRPLGTFLLTRTPAWVHQFRYHNAEFQQNRARARWNFALKAVEHSLRQQSWSWNYIKKKFDERKRVVELSKCRALYLLSYSPREEYDETAYVELDDLENCLSRGDRRLYKSIMQAEIRKICVHPEYCDECGNTISGARFFCLQCIGDDLIDQIDLCVKCIDTSPSRDDFKHEPDHTIIKVGRLLLEQQKAYIVTNARKAHERVDKIFPDNDRSCSCCSEPVPTSFWFCSSCVAEGGDHALYCDNCTLRDKMTLAHEDGHPSLVRWLKSQSDANSTRALLSLNHRLDALEKIFVDQGVVTGEREASMNERITDLETKIDERFNRVEELLQLIIANRQG